MRQNGKPLEISDRIRQLNDGRQLQICTLGIADSARYTCIASNLIGVVDSKTHNITNIDMVNKKPEEELEKERENEEKNKIDAVVEPKLLTPLEQKLGSEWKTNCINKYGSKMSALVEYLHNLFLNPENRVIIFSQYDKMLKLICKTLNEFNIKFIYCSGNNYVINKRFTIY